ncbi:hypothetical protein BH23GEM3_BH23GEM3_03170 [soil metagenome]
MGEIDITARLRDRIVGALHLGQLAVGERLPSIREIAREADVDHRRVAEAYRTLEREGLVEVRGRSGVYALEQDRLGERMLAETARWMGTVLTEGWKRRVTVPDLPDLIRRCTATVQVRSAFIESTADHLAALCAELSTELGFSSQAVPYSSVSPRLWHDPGEPDQFPVALRDAHLWVTTAFHASTLRRAAAAMRKPLVVLKLHPDVAARIRRHVVGGGLTVVCVDPAFGERVRTVFAPNDPGRIRVVRAADRGAFDRLDRAEPVLLTRAAHQRLGETGLAMIVPQSPSISPESVRELAEHLIRINFAAAEEERGDGNTVPRRGAPPGASGE